MQDDDDVNDINRENTVRLKDVYEPDEIAERLLTEEDDAIRIKDIPERLQVYNLNDIYIIQQLFIKNMVKLMIYVHIYIL